MTLNKRIANPVCVFATVPINVETFLSEHVSQKWDPVLE